MNTVQEALVPPTMGLRRRRSMSYFMVQTWLTVKIIPHNHIFLNHYVIHIVLVVKRKKSRKAPIKRSVRPAKTKTVRSAKMVRSVKKKVRSAKPAKTKTVRSAKMVRSVKKKVRSAKPAKIVRPAKTSRPAGTEKSISSITESTKTISKEIKTISKIFIDSHKILESMKVMISTLSSTMQHIDKHSKQITLLENESQKIQTGLMQLNQRANSVKTSSIIKEDIEKRLATIENESNFAQVKETMSECLENTKIGAQALEKISASLNNTADAGKIESKLDSNAKMLEDVGKLLHSHAQEQDGMDKNIESEISEKISTISREVAGLREQIRSVLEAQKTDELAEHVGSMVSKTEVLMGIPAELQELQSRLNAIEGKVSEKNSNEKQPSVTLLEYQVKIRMISESKYGDADDLESMASQTSEILKTVGADKGASVSKWGVSRILECADRWELRFSDTLSMMKDMLGADVLKEAIRIKQIKDVYGVRAVEDTKSLLNIT